MEKKILRLQLNMETWVNVFAYALSQTPHWNKKNTKDRNAHEQREFEGR